jgi:hypothetical protein
MRKSAFDGNQFVLVFVDFPAKIKAPKMGMGSPKTAEKADDSCRATASRSVS